MTAISVAAFSPVVYSAGKVFEGLSTGRLDTENFLRSGGLEGITSRSGLALLQVLRDVAQFIIDHGGHPVDAAFVKAVNERLTRSAALHPGRLRTPDQRIGVQPRYGRHEPPALTDERLQHLVQTATRADDPLEGAVELFVQVAKAQPFEDGNKRTALFAANGLLLGSGTGRLLTIPVDDHDPSVADTFNDLLARAYIMDEHDGVTNLLRGQ